MGPSGSDAERLHGTKGDGAGSGRASHSCRPDRCCLWGSRGRASRPSEEFRFPPVETGKLRWEILGARLGDLGHRVWDWRKPSNTATQPSGNLIASLPASVGRGREDSPQAHRLPLAGLREREGPIWEWEGPTRIRREPGQANPRICGSARISPLDAGSPRWRPGE